MNRTRFALEIAKCASFVSFGGALAACAKAGGAPALLPASGSRTTMDVGNSNSDSVEHCEAELRQAGRELEMALDRLQSVKCSCNGLVNTAITDTENAVKFVNEALAYLQAHGDTH